VVAEPVGEQGEISDMYLGTDIGRLVVVFLQDNMEVKNKQE
jgi:hypothetical protein